MSNTLCSGLGAEVGVFMYSRYHCHLSSGSGIQFWAQGLGFNSGLRILCVWRLACSHVCVGFFWVLQFPPISKKTLAGLVTLNDPYVIKVSAGCLVMHSCPIQSVFLLCAHCVHTLEMIFSRGQSFRVNLQLWLEIPPVESNCT